MRARAAARGLLPSARSLLVAWLIVLAAGGAYAAARETPMFAVRTIDVHGAKPALAAKVRAAAAGAIGDSLISLDGGEVVGRVEAVPSVAWATYDRSFPHTLRIFVRPERTVAVLRAGQNAWLVASRGRVVARIARGTHPELPRIWVPAATEISVGGVLDQDAGRAVARVLAPVCGRRLPRRVASVTLHDGNLTFALAGGIELRFGAPSDLPLKLAVARHVLAQLPLGATYIDVSVPDRPVAGAADSQVSGLG
jgi:cell division protein FtsQ